MQAAIQARPYQNECVDAMFRSMREGSEFGLVVLPTGSGKTVIFSMFVEEVYRRYGGMRERIRICIVAHREKLVSQARDKLLKVWPESSVKIGMACRSYSDDIDIDSEIIICSIQTLLSRLGARGPSRIEPFDILLIDECHRIPPMDKKSAYRDLIELTKKLSPRRKVFGFTASPYRLNHGWIFGDRCRKGNANWFRAPAYTVSLDDMIDAGYLVPYRVKQAVNIGPELRRVPIVQGEYKASVLGEIMCRFIASAVRAWREYGEGRNHVVAFCVSIEHADLLAAEFCRQGIPAASVHSKLAPLERQRRLDAFSSGEIKVLASVDALIEGWDETCIDCVMMLRPTKSAMIYVQQAGRGLRLHEGKSDLLVLDMADNVRTHGLFSDPLVAVPGEAPPGDPPVKECPGRKCQLGAKPCFFDGGESCPANCASIDECSSSEPCGLVYHMSVKTCGECGHVFGGRKVSEPDRVELVEVEIRKGVPDGFTEIELSGVAVKLARAGLLFSFFKNGEAKPFTSHFVAERSLGFNFSRRWKILTGKNEEPRNLQDAYEIALRTVYPKRMLATKQNGLWHFRGFNAPGWPHDRNLYSDVVEESCGAAGYSRFRRSEAGSRVLPAPSGMLKMELDDVVVEKDRKQIMLTFVFQDHGRRALARHRIDNEKLSAWNFGKEWKALTMQDEKPFNLDMAYDSMKSMNFPKQALMRRNGARYLFCGFCEAGWPVVYNMNPGIR